MKMRWSILWLVAALPAQAFALPADWAERDLEARWVAYRADLAANSTDAKRKERWVQGLADAKDWPFLEWIAIYEGWNLAGPVLRKADAPQWFRVGVWNLQAADSHNLDGAQKAVLAAGGRGRAWFEAWPAAARGAAAGVAEKLQAYEPEAVPDWLPPLDGNELLVPFLDGGVLQELGDRKRAEPGVRYVHQVERALAAMRVWNEIDGGHVHKMLALTKRAEPVIRTAAFDALAHVPSALVPWRALLSTALAEGDRDVRGLALLAAMASRHPQVVLTCFDLAFDGAHPCQSAAVMALQHRHDQGLVDLATRELAGNQTLDARQREQVQSLLLAAAPRNPLPVLTVWLEVAAWADLTSNPRAGTILTSLREFAIGNHAQLAAVVPDLRRDWEPQATYAAPEKAELQRRVRGWLDQWYPSQKKQ